MKKRMTLLSITALALLVGPGMQSDAAADVRVNATLRTPNVTVRVGNTPYGHYRGIAHKPLPIVHVHRHVVITRQDRKIAWRLAQFTGVPARDMLYLKSRGYTWREIGRWLGVPRRALKAARNHVSWERFMYASHFDRCDTYCDSGCDHDRRRDRRRVVVTHPVYETYDR